MQQRKLNGKLPVFNRAMVQLTLGTTANDQTLGKFYASTTFAVDKSAEILAIIPYTCYLTSNYAILGQASIRLDVDYQTTGIATAYVNGNVSGGVYNIWLCFVYR